MKYLDDKKREEFDLVLNSPAEGTASKTQRWTAEQEADDFMRLMNGE